MRQQNDIGLILTFIRLFLQHGINRNIEISQNARDVSKHTRFISGAHTQVIGGFNFVDRQNGEIGQLIRLEGQMRHAMMLIGGVQTCHIDQISNHGRRGGLCASAFAVIQGCAHRIALHQHGIHRAFHVGD